MNKVTALPKDLESQEYERVSVDDVVAFLATDLSLGLTKTEVEHRRQRDRRPALRQAGADPGGGDHPEAGDRGAAFLPLGKKVHGDESAFPVGSWSPAISIQSKLR
jgi:hypothetical protein